MKQLSPGQQKAAKHLLAGEQDPQTGRASLNIVNQRSGGGLSGLPSPTASHATIKRNPSMNRTSPRRLGASAKKLEKLVEASASKAGNNKFDDSRQDKSSIMELAQIPKIRNKLESLKRRDRFSTSPRFGDGEGTQPGRGLGAYLDSERFKARAGIRNPQSILHSARPLSIADSEIQRVAEPSGDGLIHEPSKASLDDNVNMHDLRRRQGKPYGRNQPQLHTLDGHGGVEQPSSLTKIGRAAQAPPHGGQRFVTIQEGEAHGSDGSLGRHHQTIDARRAGSYKPSAGLVLPALT